MPENEIAKIVDGSARKLLQIASPPVRYYLLTDTLERPPEDAMVRQALQECAKYGPRIKLLKTMREDGTWPISPVHRREEEYGRGPPYGWTYITMLRNLNDLADYVTADDEGRVRVALEKILSWQTDEGYIPGPWDVTFPLPQFNGYALRMLSRFGMEKDPRVQKLIRWLLSVQRPDGGWRVPYLEDVKYLPKYKLVRQSIFIDMIREGKVPPYDAKDFDNIPSCIWTTMMICRGFAQSLELSKRVEVRRSAEFFLDRFFQRNYHPLFFQSPSHWTRLRDPTYYGSGLCALDLLTWLGFGTEDPRMHRPMKWLIDSRSPDGHWDQSDRPDPRKAEWITEAALCTLHRWALSMDGEPFGMNAVRNSR
jgi:Prenyltransferase and squalene oxidase repeat